MATTRHTALDTDFTQQKFVASMKETLNQEPKPEDDTDDPICIYEVPRSLRDSKPEAYTPQLIGIGPYHHLKAELYEMQRYKLVCAKTAIKQFELVEFKQVTAQLEKSVEKMRSSYRGRLQLENEAMAMIFTVDGLFLLHLLDNYVKKKDIPHSSLIANSSSGKRLPGDAIVKDVLMLENQIPRFVLLGIFRKAGSESTSPDESLRGLFVNFCEIISPIKLNSGSKRLEHEHLLDFLYQYITYKDGHNKEQQSSIQTELRRPEDCGDIEASSNTGNSSVVCKAWSMISSINVGFVKIIEKFVKLILNIFQIFGISGTGFFFDKKVLLPSVSQLWHGQVKFAPVKGGTRFVKFDKKSHTLYLPVMTLKPTSEVLIRNLVAYETMDKSDSLNFKRFIELMGAIVDTVQDVELLKDSKVIDSKMSSAEIADMFNGMTGSLESKDPIIDNAIKNTNDYYRDTLKQKTKRLLKKYIYHSWRILSVFASILLLLLMCLQTFCEVYNCPAMFRSAT